MENNSNTANKKVELARGIINEIRTSWGTHHMTPALTLKTLAHFQKRNRTSVSVPTNFPRCQDSFLIFFLFFSFLRRCPYGKRGDAGGGGLIAIFLSFSAIGYFSTAERKMNGFSSGCCVDVLEKKEKLMTFSHFFSFLRRKEKLLLLVTSYCWKKYSEGLFFARIHFRKKVE